MPLACGQGAWRDGKYTAAQYRQWLDGVRAQLEICLTEGKWPKGADEFGYLYCADITYGPWFVVDPTAQELMSRQEGRDVPRIADKPVGQTAIRESLQAEYELAFRTGDAKAIFEWASILGDGESLRAPWVLEQLIGWRRAGTPDARQQFDRFMQEYWNPTGVRKPETVFVTIERDQTILCAYLDRRGLKPEEQLFEELGEQQTPKIGAETVRKIVSRYRRHFGVWKTGVLGPFPMLPR
jgi:hypothetical protein